MSTSISLDDATKTLDTFLKQKGIAIRQSKLVDSKIRVDVYLPEKESNSIEPVPARPVPPPSGPVPVSPPVPPPGPRPFHPAPPTLEKYREGLEAYRSKLESNREKKHIPTDEYSIGIDEYRRRILLYKDAQTLIKKEEKR